MANHGSGRLWRATWQSRGWLGTILVTSAIGLTLAAGPLPHEGQPAELWTVLVQTGDELAAGQPTATLGDQPLTARKAYLLAFHQAQDAGDLEHMLAVADRLDAASEPDLAIHVRRAADVLLEELGR
jgi:hypothetical protein